MGPAHRYPRIASGDPAKRTLVRSPVERRSPFELVQQPGQPGSCGLIKITCPHPDARSSVCSGHRAVPKVAIIPSTFAADPFRRGRGVTRRPQVLDVLDERLSQSMAHPVSIRPQRQPHREGGDGGVLVFKGGGHGHSNETWMMAVPKAVAEPETARRPRHRRSACAPHRGRLDQFAGRIARGGPALFQAHVVGRQHASPPVRAASSPSAPQDGAQQVAQASGTAKIDPLMAALKCGCLDVGKSGVVAT